MSDHKEASVGEEPKELQWMERPKNFQWIERPSSQSYREKEGHSRAEPAPHSLSVGSIVLDLVSSDPEPHPQHTINPSRNTVDA